MIETLRNIQILKKRLWSDFPYISESTRQELRSLSSIVVNQANVERGNEIFELAVEELNRLCKMVEYSDKTGIAEKLERLHENIENSYL